MHTCGDPASAHICRVGALCKQTQPGFLARGGTSCLLSDMTGLDRNLAACEPVMGGGLVGTYIVGSEAGLVDTAADCTLVHVCKGVVYTGADQPYLDP